MVADFYYLSTVAIVSVESALGLTGLGKVMFMVIWVGWKLASEDKD